jgi:arylsulfatase
MRCSLACLTLLVLTANACADERQPARPNVVVVLADDLGYSDTGCYGGEIETPNLNALAADGLRFTQFYNTARCWPTRGALLTGYYAQAIRRDALPGVRSGGQGQRPAWARLLPDMLEAAGYRSYHSGKWHVDGQPLAQGFHQSYLLQDQGRFFSPRKHFLNDQPLPAIDRDSGYYGTTAIATHAVSMLQGHAAEHPGKPFFLYLAFTAPHFPLQALPEDIERYRGRYDRGWDEVRAARWERIRQLGLVTSPRSEVEPSIGPPYHFADDLETLGPDEVNRPITWNELTGSQQAFQATKMALHAAMVDRMDQELGRVLTQLRTMGAWENTWICFLSDNGASAEIMVRDDGHDPAAAPGSADSYLCLGPGWSTVCNTPFRRHKTWVHEGGIATPLIVHWPQGIAARNEVRRTPGHVVDLVPTIRELAGLDPDAAEQGTPARHGRSLVPAFASDQAPRTEPLWWLHEGNRAIRHGDWKLVAAKGDPWELYDLARDRCETTNLAAEHPARVEELSRAWEARFADMQRLAQ